MFSLSAKDVVRDCVIKNPELQRISICPELSGCVTSDDLSLASLIGTFLRQHIIVSLTLPKSLYDSFNMIFN